MKISIITASWNSARTIQYTIDSVLRQIKACQPAGVEVEHIIVDGGSKDGSADIIKQNEPRYNGMLKWVSEKDKGIYDAMNKGIRMADGDVVGLLNSDDFFSNDKVLLKVAQAFTNDSTIDALYGDIHFVKDGDLNKCTRYFSSRYFKTGLLRFGFMPAHPSFYCRKSIYDKYGLYDTDLRTSSDFEMIVRLLYKYRIRTKYLNMDFVTMRSGGESTASLASKRKVNRDIALSLKKHGIYSNQMFQGIRYLWRIGEIIYTRLKY